MQKNKKSLLNLDQLEINSFVTNLKSGQETALIGGKKKVNFADDSDTTATC